MISHAQKRHPKGPTRSHDFQYEKSSHRKKEHQLCRQADPCTNPPLPLINYVISDKFPSLSLKCKNGAKSCCLAGLLGVRNRRTYGKAPRIVPGTQEGLKGYEVSPSLSDEVREERVILNNRPG